MATFSWDPRTWGSYVSAQVDRAAQATVDLAVKTGIADQLAAESPEYKTYQTKVQRYAEQHEMYAVAGMIAGISCGTLGACLTLTGRNKTGYALMIVSVPIDYFSYNSNKIYENLRYKFANELLQHLSKSKGEIKIDLKKLKATLQKRTFCYDPFIEFHIRSFIAHMESIQKLQAKRLIH